MEQINEGITGQQAAQIIYANDMENSERFNNYFPKGNTSRFAWGVADEEGTLLFWVDLDLKMHVVLHPDSYPPAQLPLVENDTFDFAVADAQGNIIFGILANGDVYPAPSAAPPAPAPAPFAPKTTIRASDITQPANVIADGMWNQWIEPYAAIDDEGTLWAASVGFRGNLYVTKRPTGGMSERIKLGHIVQNNTSDDHNCPAVLLDDRVGAPYPVMVFQADHNTTPMRYWRFDNKDIGSWNPVTETIGAERVAYTQAFRFGDEIFVFSRVASGGRPWRVAYSSDNGDTWTARNLFTRGNSWLYMLFRLKDDKSGLNIACHDHPLNGTDQNIYMLQLDFATGAVTAPSKPIIIADIRAAIADTGFSPIDPFTVAALVYDAQGAEITRLWDISRNSAGDIAVGFNVMPNASPTLLTFEASTYNIATIDSAGAITGSAILGAAGTPIENPKGANFYFAGLSLLSETKALISKWESNAQRDNTGDTQDDYGMSTVEVVDFSDTSSPARALVCYSDKKVIRPFAIDDVVMLVECNYFNDYFNFYSNVYINNISIIN